MVTDQQHWILYDVQYTRARMAALKKLKKESHRGTIKYEIKRDVGPWRHMMIMAYVIDEWTLDRLKKIWFQ